MTLIARIVILLGGLLCATDVRGQVCSGGSLSPHTGFCYHVHNKKKNKIEDARLVCRNDYGGDIPSIFTGDENAFIHNLLTTEGSESQYWIGVNDLYEEDLFRDVMLNEVLTYDNWGEDEPVNESGFDCARMLRDDGKWVACPCTKYSDFDEGVICQQPPDPNPFTLCPVNMLPYTTPWYTECYWFSMDEHRALESSSKCAAMGSKLAFIEDQALNDFIYSYQGSSKLDTVWIGTQQILDGSGLTYLSVEFSTTIPTYYDNFISEYSGSESPVCAAMIRTEFGTWSHLSCDDAKHHYICQYNATAYYPNTTSAVTTVGSTTTMATTTPTNTSSPTTTEATTILTTTPTTTPSPTTTGAATTEATTIPTTTPTTTLTTTPSPNTTDFTIPLPNSTTITQSPTTPEHTTSEATTTLPITSPTTPHSPTTTEPTASEATTTVPITTPTTSHSPTTTEGTTTLSTTTTKLTTSPSTAESSTTLPPTTPTTNVITSQSATTESTTSQSTTQDGSSSVGSTTPATTTTEPTPTTSETTTPTVRISTGETGFLQVDSAVSRRNL